MIDKTMQGIIQNNMKKIEIQLLEVLTKNNLEIHYSSLIVNILLIKLLSQTKYSEKDFDMIFLQMKENIKHNRENKKI